MSIRCGPLLPGPQLFSNRWALFVAHAGSAGMMMMMSFTCIAASLVGLRLHPWLVCNQQPRVANKVHRHCFLTFMQGKRTPALLRVTAHGEGAPSFAVIHTRVDE
jgi:hypothetical protein